MQRKRISFIGGGNMASALLARLATTGHYDLRVADPGDAQRARLADIEGVGVFADNAPAVADADCVVFAVKPQIMQGVCLELAPCLRDTHPLIVSVAAGLNCSALSRWLNDTRRIVRVMPNTPALLGAGATGLYADRDASDDDRSLASALFDAVGVAEWVDEEALIDVVTAVSGSGPAYFFYVLEAMEDAAVAQGLPRSLAQQLARQTALGAAKMALNETDQLDAVRQRVTSPGGTTAAALEVLATADIASIMRSAMDAARSRAQSLAEEFGAG